MVAIFLLSLHRSRRLLPVTSDFCETLYRPVPRLNIFIVLEMFLTSYLSEFKRHLKLIGFLPGFIPYEYHEGLICLSKNKIRHKFYRLSLVLSVFHCILMCCKLVVDKYDIFLTLLGATVIIVSLISLLMRWNWSCDTKFIDMLNQFIAFESHLKVHGLLKTSKGS